LLPGAATIDLAFPFELNTNRGKVHFVCGPMGREQAAKSYFLGRKPEILPETGLYFDMDYYREYDTGEAPFDRAKIMADVEPFAMQPWETHLQLKRHLSQ